MAEGGVERRLAAIVAIDVAGYSRLMGADEDGTLSALKAHREATTPIGERHGGRMVGTSGDGELWEFPSVTEAVLCAVEVQAIMAERNQNIPEERRMLYRIGINLGDVMIDGEDIYGDGINVAARLEALAEPGGICVSRTVRDNVRDRLDIAFADQGEVEVKNIARPVRVFRVLAEGEAERTAVGLAGGLRRWFKYVAMTFVIAMLAGGGLWWWSQQPDFEPADPKKFAFELPEKPSIAVLPFEYLGKDREENAYLADALGQHVVGALSFLSGIFIIDWRSMQKTKGQNLEVRNVAEKFGVQFVLKGTVQKTGNRIRLNAELTDAISGHTQWTKTFDRDLEKWFEIQDAIAKDIASSMHVRFQGGGDDAISWASSTKNLNAYKLSLQGFDEMRKYTPESHAKARKLFAMAEKEDPNFVAAKVVLAITRFTAGRFGYVKDRQGEVEAGMLLSKAALKIAPDSAIAVGLDGFLDVWRGQYVSAIEKTERAVSMNPNSAAAQQFLGVAYLYAGRADVAVKALKRSGRLYGQYEPGQSFHLTFALVDAGRHDEALAHIDWYIEQKGRTDISELIYRALALAGLGREGEAKLVISDVLKRKPDLTTRNMFKSIAYPYKDDWGFKNHGPTLARLGLPIGLPLEKPAIAVLPFANLSDDKEQEYFADGMTDDLITDLSKLSGLIVIARNSVFTYKGKAVKVQEVAKDLNVTHVLEGSVRRAGGQIRINAQLIDAKTGAHLWAEKYSRQLEDVFALQDDVVHNIVGALKVKLDPAETTRVSRIPTANLDAYDSFLKAEAISNRMERKALGKALDLYKKAIDLDPNFAEAHAADAWLSLYVYRSSFWRIMGHMEARRRYETSSRQALMLDPENETALRARAHMFALDGEHRQSAATARRIVELYPNSAHGYLTLAGALTNLAATDDALRTVVTALRLDPNLDASRLAIAAWVYFGAGDYEKAADYYRQVVSLAPKSFSGHNGIIASQGQLGNLQEARVSFQTVLGFWPAYNISFFANIWDYWNPDILGRWIDGLRKAGVPELPFGFKGDEASRLTGAEIRVLLTGQKISGKARMLGSFEMVLSETGRRLTKFTTHEGTGDYFIDGDLFCQTSDKAMLGRPYCSAIYRNPSGSRAEKNEYVYASVGDTWSFSVAE